MSNELINLLCIIHRDGGQYIQQHGPEKACADAVNILHSWKTLPDKLATLEVMISSLENENRLMRETLRDRYASAAITGILATGHHYKHEVMVDNAFHIADQMLSRRNCA